MLHLALALLPLFFVVQVVLFGLLRTRMDGMAFARWPISTSFPLLPTPFFSFLLLGDWGWGLMSTTLLLFFFLHVRRVVVVNQTCLWKSGKLTFERVSKTHFDFFYFFYFFLSSL